MNIFLASLLLAPPFLEDNLVGDNGEQSIHRSRWPNSLAILNDTEELYPSLSRLGSTSLLKMRGEAEALEAHAIPVGTRRTRKGRGVPPRTRT
jgi:hypothetical protein